MASSEEQTMEKLPINEKDVKNILRNKDKLKADIHRKMYFINRDMAQNDEMYELVAYPSTEVSDMPRRKGWHKDLGDVVLKYKVLLENKKNEYKEVLWELIMQEEQIDRVWLCFMVLDNPYFSILENIYVKEEKYEIVEQRSGYSHQVFEKYRKRGIEAIMLLYNSDKTISQLTIESKSKERTQTDTKKQSLEESNQQISIEDIISMCN